MSTLRTFHADGIPHQVLFTTEVSTSRLCAPRPDHDLEPVIITRCLLIDDHLRTVADGIAICAEADPYDHTLGAALALDRMLTEAEEYVRGWTEDTSRGVIHAYDAATRSRNVALTPAPHARPSAPMNLFEASAVYKDVLRREAECRVAETLVETLTDTYIRPSAAPSEAR